jgi:hypothetical protein
VASLTPDLRIAISEGAGSGRFLAVALLDALDGGGDLSRLRLQPPSDARGKWSVDFVFEHAQPAYREVIRAGLDVADRVVFAELLRSSPDVALDAIAERHEPRFPGAAALARALRAGSMIEFVKVDASEDPGAPRAIRLQLRRGQHFLLDLSSFGRIA